MVRSTSKYGPQYLNERAFDRCTNVAGQRRAFTRIAEFLPSPCFAVVTTVNQRMI